MTPIGIGTVDRVPDHRDHLHVRNQCSNSLVRCGVPQIERRALAAQCPGRRIGEQALVGRTLPHPFLGTVRITRTLLLRRVGSGLFTHEELRFFGIGQEKIRMLRQCDMQSCRAGLRRADDQEIWERHRESLTVRMAGMRGGIFVSSPSGTPISDCCKETSRGGALDPAGDPARSRWTGGTYPRRAAQTNAAAARTGGTGDPHEIDLSAADQQQFPSRHAQQGIGWDRRRRNLLETSWVGARVTFLGLHRSRPATAWSTEPARAFSGHG